MRHACRLERVVSLLAFALLGIAPVAGADERDSRVDALFAQWDTTVTPGCSMGAARAGVMLHARGYGMANLEHGVPNRPDTIFHVASVSKQFAAAAIALLILDGKLTEADSAQRYFPQMPPFYSKLTVGNLVHHTSGLRDHSEILELSGWRYYQDLVTTDDALGVLAKQKGLLFEPGSRYHYSNTNYLLLASIVERVTGKTLREFADERLFRPLGMARSAFRDDFSQVVPHFAAGYDRSSGHYATSLTNFSIVGYSSLLTTVEDLMRWEANFDSGRMGGEPWVRLMHSMTPLNDGKPNDYAFGVVLGTHAGLPTVEHSGGDAGYATHLLRFPDQKLSVAVLCNDNRIDARELAMRTAEIYLGLKPDPGVRAKRADAVFIQVPESQLDPLAGRYWNAATEQGVVLLREGARLYSLSGDERSPLEPIANHRFLMGDRWELEFPARGRPPASVTLKNIYLGNQLLERVREEGLTAADLAQYAGVYQSDEIDAPYRIELIDGRLVVSSIKLRFALTPVTRRLFLSPRGNVLFELDAQGRATGFRLGSREEPLAEFRAQRQ